MVRAGMKREVLESLTPWVCASCYQCTVNCPAGIKITEIMYALKRRGMEEGILPPGFDGQRFAELFTEAVCRYGRAHEFGVLTRFMALRHPIRMAKQSGSGLGLMARGRMPLFPHKIKDLENFARLVEAARAEKEPTP